LLLPAGNARRGSGLYRSKATIGPFWENYNIGNVPGRLPVKVVQAAG